MKVKMDYVTTHGDGRLLFKRDIPPELRAVAGRTTWQRSLRTRTWNATAAALHRQFLVESERDLAKWRGAAATQQPTPTITLEMPWAVSPDALNIYMASRLPGLGMHELTKQLVSAGLIPGRITENRELVKLEAVVRQWANERKVRPATLSDMNCAVRVLTDACGVKCIDEFNHDDARKAKAAVLAEDNKNGTKRKRWNMLSALFAFARANALVSVDVLRDIRLELENDSEERKDWSTDALNALFATPVWTSGDRPRAAGGEAAWWLPVLSLLHGNRLSEFAQLRVSDVIREGKYIGLKITDDGDEQHIKNEGSARTVPLHPLIRDDFERFLEWHDRTHGTEQLFPLLKPDTMKRSGGRYSTWFTKYRKEHGIYVRRQDAHSFRGTHITGCRNAGIDVSVFSRWTGHKLTGVVHTYGGMSLAAMTREIGKVVFEGVQLPKWREPAGTMPVIRRGQARLPVRPPANR